MKEERPVSREAIEARPDRGKRGGHKAGSWYVPCLDRRGNR